MNKKMRKNGDLITMLLHILIIILTECFSQLFDFIIAHWLERTQ
jgi:hypothetical protein